MRALVLFSCCLATAYAASLGYDYERNTAGEHASAVSTGSALLSSSIPADSAPAVVAPAEYTKEFYTYTAPESEFNDAAAHNQISNTFKQNLRVIFVKGPESSGLEHAALQLAKAATDDRTAIYVLRKEADISDLASKLSSVNRQSAHKPEVHFVKYRTAADAEHAQRTIQSQYDALQGPSSSVHGGVAPVLNFVSKAAAPSITASSAGAAYLPPNHHF